MKTPITHVFFDATDTLLRVRGSVGETYATLARAHGVRVPADTLQEAFTQAARSITQPVQPGLSADEISRRERRWWSDVVARTFGGPWTFENFDAFFDEVFEAFCASSAWEPVPQVRATLEHLRKRKLTLGIISDMDSRLFRLLHDFDLDGFFTGVHLSFTTGWAKPDRRLFETACRESGAAVDQAVHVGDSWDKDVMGARNAGMHGVWYRPQGARDDEWPWIADMAQLPHLIDRGVR